MRFHGFALPAVAGLLVLAQGCATKKFVTEELGKTETKLGQEVGRLQGEVNQEKSRLSGVATVPGWIATQTPSGWLRACSMAAVRMIMLRAAFEAR